MDTAVYIIDSALTDTKRVLCDEVNYSGSKNTDARPSTSSMEPVHVHTQSIENPKIALRNIKYTGEPGTLTITDVLKLSKKRYDNTNPTTLLVKYGDGIILPNFMEETTGIKCILEPWTIRLSAKDVRDAKVPDGTLTFTETK